MQKSLALGELKEHVAQRRRETRPLSRRQRQVLVGRVLSVIFFAVHAFQVVALIDCGEVPLKREQQELSELFQTPRSSVEFDLPNSEKRRACSSRDRTRLVAERLPVALLI